MSAQQIIAAWKKQEYKPIYWLEGDEPYFIDQIVSYAEHNLLPESEASFNLTVYYGKDAEWQNIINDCRSYPMFSERKVVILKEGQMMRDIMKLEGYIENPMPSTILIVSYKGKKIDARTKMAKLLKKNAEVLLSKKMYDNQLPTWINDTVQAKNFTITPKASSLIIESIGNDISRIANEINKLIVNLKDRKNITDDDVENYIGISKDYNVFELQNALARRDMTKAIKIVNYFASNPKDNPIIMILPTLYSYFAKIQMVAMAKSDGEIASALGVNPFFAKDYKMAYNNYGYQGAEKAILLLQKYNLRAIGIKDGGNTGAELLKECVVKIML